MRLDGMLKRLEALESDVGRLDDAEVEAFMASVSDAELERMIGWMKANIVDRRTAEKVEADRLRAQRMSRVELDRELKQDIEIWRSHGSPSA
jgi:acylphosphatase